MQCSINCAEHGRSGKSRIAGATADSACHGCVVAAVREPIPDQPGWIGYVGYEVGRHDRAFARPLQWATLAAGPSPGVLRRPQSSRCADAAMVAAQLDFGSDRATPRPTSCGPGPDAARPLGAAAAQPQIPTRTRIPSAGSRVPPCRSNFTPDDYRAGRRRCIEYIAAGDIFQVNLSQRFRVDDAPPPAGHLPRPAPPQPGLVRGLPGLRSRAGQPHRAIAVQLAGAVPPRARAARASPGRSRAPARACGEPAADAAAAADLLASPKDNAELAMIVDLLRNDLGRVCRYGSVRVSEAAPPGDAPDRLPPGRHGRRARCARASARPHLLRATFPGGSITGAPKIRAMEIIDELEPTARGVYTGCIGIVGVDGDGRVEHRHPHHRLRRAGRLRPGRRRHRRRLQTRARVRRDARQGPRPHRRSPGRHRPVNSEIADQYDPSSAGYCGALPSSTAITS